MKTISIKIFIVYVLVYFYNTPVGLCVILVAITFYKILAIFFLRANFNTVILILNLVSNFVYMIFWILMVFIIITE
jgi:hypothetical protein